MDLDQADPSATPSASAKELSREINQMVQLGDYIAALSIPTKKVKLWRAADDEAIRRQQGSEAMEKVRTQNFNMSPCDMTRTSPHLTSLISSHITSSHLHYLRTLHSPHRTSAHLAELTSTTHRSPELSSLSSLSSAHLTCSL